MTIEIKNIDSELCRYRYRYIDPSLL